jgi:hypothetical protein
LRGGGIFCFIQSLFGIIKKEFYVRLLEQTANNLYNVAQT